MNLLKRLWSAVADTEGWGPAVCIMVGVMFAYGAGKSDLPTWSMILGIFFCMSGTRWAADQARARADTKWADKVMQMIDDEHEAVIRVEWAKEAD